MNDNDKDNDEDNDQEINDADELAIEDEVIKQAQYGVTKCGYKSKKTGKYGTCKNSFFSHLTCSFCKLAYCIKHAMPETHGCSKEAQKKTTTEFRKTQANNAFNLKNQDQTSKPLQQHQKRYLESELKKKIQEKTDERTGAALKDNNNNNTQSKKKPKKKKKK